MNSMITARQITEVKHGCRHMACRTGHHFCHRLLHMLVSSADQADTIFQSGPAQPLPRRIQRFLLDIKCRHAACCTNSTAKKHRIAAPSAGSIDTGVSLMYEFLYKPLTKCRCPQLLTDLFHNLNVH